MEGVFGRYFKGDRVIWIVVILLSLISLLVVYSSTGTLAHRYQGGNTAHYMLRQLVFLIAGFGVVFLTHLIPYRVYGPISQLMLYISIPLLLFTLLFGATINQAARWLEIPGLGITIQTSDFAKLALIMYVAMFLSSRQHDTKSFTKVFLPLVVPIGVVCLLILPANFSTAVMLGGVCWLLMFIGRVSLKYLLAFTFGGVLLIGIFVGIALHTERVSRVQTWKNRIENFAKGEGGENYQAQQSKIAIATGGLIGKGPGNSTQRNFLPHPYSDFIYAIIVEEYGLIGGVAVLLLFLIVLHRTGILVKRAQRTFPALLAIGLGLMIVFQALVNMSVAVNLIPVTGQPLPMVSMGGTSLLFTCVAFGIILSISRSQNKAELFDGEDEHKDHN